ncbi:MAG: T9SS type A sorting domain-containing protein, partial [Sphingobacteriales bacterium]
FSVFHTQFNRTHGDAKITVFVDFNNNKQYDIPEERIYTGFTSVGDFNLMGQVVIPNTVIVNVPTGMRVILNNDVSPNMPSDSACGEYTSGETEDYIVKFLRRFPATVNEIATLNNVSLYPNPTSGRFTIGFNNNKAGEVKIRVSNVTGQQLLNEVYTEQAGSHSHELDLGGRARGVYFVELEANGIKTTHRLVLQ